MSIGIHSVIIQDTKIFGRILVEEIVGWFYVFNILRIQEIGVVV